MYFYFRLYVLRSRLEEANLLSATCDSPKTGAASMQKPVVLIVEDDLMIAD